MSQPPAKPPERDTVVAAQFKRIWNTVIWISVLCLVRNVVLAVVVPNPNGQIAQLVDGCSTVRRMGFGAIIGLLGGKAIQ